MAPHNSVHDWARAVAHGRGAPMPWLKPRYRRRAAPRRRRDGVSRGAPRDTQTTSTNLIPVLPRVVTYPTAPSDFTLHFILVSPVPSCFLAISRSSRSSPGLSFLVDSLIFLVSSFEASMSKPSVRIVSLTTLNTTPSWRYLLPWFPARVTQPSALSRKAFTRTRSTAASSSLAGPSRTWTTSPTSNLRTDFASLILMESVIATSFTTFINTIRTASKVVFDTLPAFSSSMAANARRTFSSFSASACPSAFGNSPMKATSSSSPKESPPFVLIALNRASAVKLFSA
mmetsp:Transcript_51113/g.100976  ORF Transcript_51113/g.100976 Transcript_51113/m.100976 type:complete len:286 (-) Transcript_51113:934-1791(-)